jgi:Icc-related predicted phosphoesterase
MKVACLADLHGETPDLPDADLVVIAGDLLPDGDLFHQWRWLHARFKPWVAASPAPVCYVAGNHDRVFQEQPDLVDLHEDHLHYLQDSYAEVMGLTIYGMPWTLGGGRWAFKSSEAEINRRLSRCDRRPDIVVSHCPPYGLGDQVANRHEGSGALLEFIGRSSPSLVVTGHIHESYGVYQSGDCTIVNAAYHTADMIPANRPILLDL